MHSMRSGGATAALSIGSDVFTIARWGIWASISSGQQTLWSSRPKQRSSFLGICSTEDTRFITCTPAGDAEVAW